MDFFVRAGFETGPWRTLTIGTRDGELGKLNSI